MQEPAQVYDPGFSASVAIEAPRVRERTLATSVLWLLGSNFAYAACQWCTVVALAKLQPASALGHFGLALAVTNPIVMVTGSSIKAFQSSDVLGRYRFADYVNLRLAANLVAAAVIGIIVVAGMIGRDAAAVLIPIAVAKLADATSETCYGCAQKHDRMRYVAISKTVRGALGLTALTAAVAAGGSVAMGAWALAWTWIAFLFAVDLRVANALEPALGRPRPAVLRRLVRETAPLGGVGGVNAMIQSAPRYLLQLSHGAAAVGYYTALSSLGPVVGYFAGAIGNASAPRLGWALASRRDGHRRLARRLVVGSVLASLVLALLAVVGGRQFLRLAYTPDYTAYWSTFVLIALAAGLGLVGSAAYYFLIAARRLGLLLGIQCLGLAVTTLVGFVLVPRLGPEGAALGAAAGATAMAIVSAAAMLRGEAR
jgi:O-antigen/teichoic acid export membrane protein